MKNMKKILVLALAALLLVAVSVGGTVAYLTSTPDAVENTFTAANIEITLSETPNDDKDIDGDGIKNEWVAQLIPGKKYVKDPLVKVDTTKTTVPIYVYFQIDNAAVDYVDFNLNLTGWTAVDGKTNVYYRAWDPTTDASDYQWYLLKGDGAADYKNGFVTIKNLTADKTSTVTDAVKMTFKAYAIQQEGFSPATGWAEVSK